MTDGLNHDAVPNHPAVTITETPLYATSLLRTVFDNSLDGILLADDAGKYLDANPAACKMLGLPRERLLAMHVGDLVTPSGKSAAELYADYSQIGSQSGEFTFVRSDGQVVAVEYRANRVAPGVNLSIVRDVTERNRMAEAQQILAAVVQSSSSGMVSIDLQGRVHTWNAGAERLYGYTSDEAVGKHVWEFTPPATRAATRRAVRRTLAGEAYEIHDTERVRKDGALIRVAMSLAAVRDPAGNIIGASAIIRDVTALHEAMYALKRSEEQLRALAAHLQGVREEERIRISREIHDELGRALTALKLDIANLQRRLAADEAAVQTLDGMAQLVDETGRAVHRLAWELRPSILDDLGLDAAIDWLARDFQRRSGIRCTCHVRLIGSGPDAVVSTALFRILQEALTNVARHSEATDVTIRLRCTRTTVTMMVRDYGVGMRADVAEGKRSFGLVGMRERAHVLGGEVTVRAAHGRGTLVTAKLPCPCDVGASCAPNCS